MSTVYSLMKAHCADTWEKNNFKCDLKNWSVPSENYVLIPFKMPKNTEEFFDEAFEGL
eukprot:NODE_182_length_2258_cov_77.141240_g155_i0.p6 GENE.NODE_182_length_2258_cov_77.141240_g155_i0~~NODE_182_length_2258_cov_77.141240_g155_i0.p6  ORF type:complete len:58 (+),score=9.04 NODE_182_length_2258_cov_77.141240_g155_i0:1171-1344(+)